MAFFLQLLALTAFAVAQPLLQLIRQNPEFLSVHQVQRTDLLVLTGVLLLAPPLVLLLVVSPARAVSRRICLAVQSLMVGLLLTVILLPLADGLPGPGGWMTLATAGIPGVLGSRFYYRSPALRRNLAWLAVAAPVFLAVFLGSGGIRKVLVPARGDFWTGEFPEETPVILVVFDELPVTSLMNRDLELDEELFPGFARLAGLSTWFRNATSLSGSTVRSVPSILSGRFPAWETTPSLKDLPRNIFTLLGPGHRVVVHEPQTDLCPARWKTRPLPGIGQRLESLGADLWVLYQHIIVPRRWTRQLVPVAGRWGYFQGPVEKGKAGRPETKLDRFRDLVSSLDRTDRPLLGVIHCLLPHNPYRFLPDGRVFSWRRTVPLQSDGRWGDDELVRIHSYRRHLLQLAAVDRLVGELLDRLDELGVLDSALMVVTADHGASWRAGQGHRRHTGDNLLDIMAVPLFIKAPGQREGRVDERLAQTVDILPTVAGLLGISPGWEFDGVDLFASTAEPRRRLDFVDPDTGTYLEVSPQRLAEREPVVLWKAELFGSGGGPGRLFRLGSHADLLGRPVAGFSVTDHPRLVAEIPNWKKLVTVDHGALFLPAEINGAITGYEGAERLDLALAINDTLAGVSRTYLAGPRPGWRAWQVMVPPSVLRDGWNGVELFLIRDGVGGPALARIPQRGESFLNRELGGRQVIGVAQEGFYPGETWGGAAARWTSGKARLGIPLRKGERPRFLRVKLASTGPRGTRLVIRANGVQLMAEDLPRGEWEGRLSLAGVEPGGRLDVCLESGTFVPAVLNTSSTDRRTLGVSLTSLVVEGSPGP